MKHILRLNDQVITLNVELQKINVEILFLQLKQNSHLKILHE